MFRTRLVRPKRLTTKTSHGQPQKYRNYRTFLFIIGEKARVRTQKQTTHLFNLGLTGFFFFRCFLRFFFFFGVRVLCLGFGVSGSVIVLVTVNARVDSARECTRTGFVVSMIKVFSRDLSPLIRPMCAVAFFFLIFLTRVFEC